jgi:hypothetical protein
MPRGREFGNAALEIQSRPGAIIDRCPTRRSLSQIRLPPDGSYRVMTSISRRAANGIIQHNEAVNEASGKQSGTANDINRSVR